MGHRFPLALARKIATAANIKTVIETGTYKGDTTRLVAPYFDKVITIEGDSARFHKTLPTFLKFDNIIPLQGNSRIALYSVLTRIHEPVIFWLDAHWCSGGAIEVNAQKGDECPLLDELAAIRQHSLANEHIILIDDARLFLKPPPYPHDPKQWPDINQIWEAIPPSTLTHIAHDIIAIVPPRFQQMLYLKEWFDG